MVEWGPGAFVYSMGYSDMLSIPGVMCLDMSAIPRSGIPYHRMRLKSAANRVMSTFNWTPTLSTELSPDLIKRTESDE